MADENKCAKCNERVTGKIMKAMGKQWHPEHFVCKVCEKAIGGTTFHEKDGDPVCSECFLKNYCDTCASCNKPIEGKTVKALGKSWHPEHFVCGGPCKKPMSGASFFEKDGKAYCQADYEKLYASKCAGCSKTILDKAIIALNAKWHKDCFKCMKCNKAIEGTKFAVANNKPMCTACN